MKIKVYQQGGGFIYTPFIPGQQQTTSGSSSSKEDDDAKIDPLDKEILGLLKDANLLPSDIAIITNALMSFQRRTQRLSSMGISGGYRSVMPGMLQIMNQVAIGKHNKEVWNDRVQEMQKHDAGSEVAMDSYGNIWTQSEEGIKKIRLSDFDPEKYRPLSVSEMLHQRERNLGFSDDIIGDTGLDIVGMKDVYQSINDIIRAYGTQDKISFLTKDSAAQAVLMDINSPDGIYKLKQTYTNADLQKAFKVLYDELPTNMQNLLKARAKISGEENPTIGAYKFINDIISNNISFSTDVSYDASASKAAGIGGAGNDDPKNLTEYSYVENLATGRNFQPPRVTTFNAGGSSIYLHAPIQNCGVINKGDGVTPVGPGMVDAILETVEGLKTISPQYTITFGDQLIDEMAQGQILYDGSALQRVKLPYTEVDGEITVDWETAKELEKLKEEFDGKAITPGMIREKIANNPNLIWNEETKEIEAANSMWFLTFGAIVGDDFVDGLNVNSPYLSRMAQDKSEFWHKRYEEAAKYGFVNHPKGAPQRTNAPTDRGFLGIDWSRTKYYHGNVYMPILNELAGATQYYPKTTHLNNMQTWADNQRDLDIERRKQTGQIELNW